MTGLALLNTTNTRSATIRTASTICIMNETGGRLTVAHGMSREWIEKHHEGAACKVSVGLMQADALAGIFSDYLDVLNVISESRMYQVVGEKRA